MHYSQWRFIDELTIPSRNRGEALHTVDKVFDHRTFTSNFPVRLLHAEKCLVWLTFVQDDDDLELLISSSSKLQLAFMWASGAADALASAPVDPVPYLVTASFFSEVSASDIDECLWTAGLWRPCQFSGCLAGVAQSKTF